MESQNEVLKNAIEIEAKASLQPTSNIREIDSYRYQSRRPVKKGEISAFSKFSKEQNKKKAKPANTQSNTPTLSNQPSNRGQQKNRGNCHSLCSDCRDSGTPATNVNATKVKKQD